MSTGVDETQTASGFGPDRFDRTVPPLRIVTATDVLAPVGGIEVCVYEDTTALVTRGHHVDLLYTESGVQRADLEILGVHLRGPVTVRFEPSRALRGLASFVRSAYRVARLRPDVLWLNRSENIIWAQVVSLLARVPLVVHLHHAPNYRLQSQLMTGVAEFVAVSEYIKSVWVARGIQADRITVVHNAVPLDRYPVATEAERVAARAALDLPDGVRVAMYFGRISRDKGVLTILQAWRSLDLDPTEARLVFVGDAASADDEIGELLRSFPEGSVAHVPNQVDVVPILHAADVVVAPSWAPESFGRTTVEAMSAGIPAIASDLGGSAEVLADGMERLLVVPGDAADLAGRLSELLTWRTSEPGLGAAVHAHVARRFPYEPHVDQLSDVLLAHRSRRRTRASQVPRGNRAVIAR
ncbi:glycosyltransferase involved in cell wall biosynthesis [Frondihabitans sp. PhB188]|uniref:glycosyltransferase family 4 protein n=1 Tax=Frondihabitans sp. PhB188 TaxID=2485200 RepID=UPI000F4A40D3|nr:glycosyltransferase family 4 protein [Frondihabitans sp. PhB188]ROQ39577.1 glycosyltransferase involved in cell wall biosynthesis [Frondihabitans sp. PhB188]